MAHPRPTAADTGDIADIPLARPEDLALAVATEAAPGTEEIPDTTVQVAVTYPDWRLDEIKRKYSDDEPREPRRSFYHPYG